MKYLCLSLSSDFILLIHIIWIEEPRFDLREIVNNQHEIESSEHTVLKKEIGHSLALEAYLNAKYRQDQQLTEFGPTDEWEQPKM